MRRTLKIAVLLIVFVLPVSVMFLPDSQQQSPVPGVPDFAEPEALPIDRSGIAAPVESTIDPAIAGAEGGEETAYRRPGVIRSGLEDFQLEPRDEEWAAATESGILASLSRMVTGAYSIEVECRTHQCRVEILDDTCPLPRTDPVAGMQRFAEITSLVGEAGRDAQGMCLQPPLQGMLVTVLRSSAAP